MRRGHILTRDAKAPAAAALRFAAPVWTDFLRAVTRGELTSR
ncbi:protein of unknown function DUF397 [Actinobacteria bacterium OK074]|nr:protein of unknown function DUF397 [Actinobacteria bacterium OK074]